MIMEIPNHPIGNSKGLRIIKSILKRYYIKDRMEMILEKGQIILRPIHEPRKGWDEAFIKMHSEGDDQLLINDEFDHENLEDWKRINRLLSSKQKSYFGELNQKNLTMCYHLIRRERPSFACGQHCPNDCTKPPSPHPCKSSTPGKSWLHFNRSAFFNY